MKLFGKWIFLDNHIIDNLDKMYKWSNYKDLIAIEVGKNNNLSKNNYKDTIMNSYIKNNHESNSNFCHFGIYRNSNNELIGYLDFQNISKKDSELSLSIPDQNYRNKHYGIDAFIVALNYGLNIRGIENIIIRTRFDNITVKNMIKKINLQYKVEKFNENGYKVDLIRYEINNNIYRKIMEKLNGKK